MSESNLTSTFYNPPDQLKFLVLILLVLTGVFLECIVHYTYHVSVVYTQFYYLIVVIAGLWYGRTVVAIALFFGVLEVIVSWLLAPGSIPYEAILRALMLVIVAAVIWKVVEEMTRYHERVILQNTELKNVNVQLDSSRAAFLLANKKLNLLSGITRHDIKNQLTALLAYIELTRMMPQDPEMTATIDKEEVVANNILRQIEFTRTYEDIGVKAPLWINVAQQMALLLPLVRSAGITLEITTGDLEVYADPLLEKVFENLIDNSLRHGEHVKRISVSYERGASGLLLIYRDDGVGVAAGEKEKIFERGFGKHTGLGLFITREILSITDLSISEHGTPGAGVRFEIVVPEDCYRFGGNAAPAGT
ncbi:HAMP domain-containing sensor histidine kinase [Methanoregula sp.]|uniref:sensor histidine kinase n=1 Tax=Methanoregula sp. TaxID=2052170 RepID=UPI002BF09007|nr:HAMP domain-containing sensor histidine kinase [Methanoregula sp.]HVP96021.1 HAMP domain-containing sensor histidine kinase [Methanoregula sp.]